MHSLVWKKDYIRRNTRLRAPALVPELTLHLADAPSPLWTLDGVHLDYHPVDDPYWAFAWAGGLGLARFILDQPNWVAHRRVLDFAAGSGNCAFASRCACATSVWACDVDPWSQAAIQLNADLNGLDITYVSDVIDTEGPWDVIVCGDAFYDAALGARLAKWFERLSTAGTTVLIGDPGRRHLPTDHLTLLAQYPLKTQGLFEDTEFKHTKIWRWRSSGC